MTAQLMFNVKCQPISQLRLVLIMRPDFMASGKDFAGGSLRVKFLPKFPNTVAGKQKHYGEHSKILFDHWMQEDIFDSSLSLNQWK
jgi:hypothetical protein